MQLTLLPPVPPAQALTGFSRLAALEVDNNFLESLPEPLLHCPALSILIASGNIISHVRTNQLPHQILAAACQCAI